MSARLIAFVVVLFCAALPMIPPPVQAGSPVNEVWFEPNVASVDMLDLFTQPDDWDLARSRIDVFKFYSGQVGSDGWSCDVNPSAVCGQNFLQHFIDVDAFAKVGQWGMDLAIESFFAGPVMSVDPITCSTSQHIYNLTLSGSINVIQNVEANGGVVRCLAMDEPLRQWLPTYYYEYTGQVDPRPCLADSIDIIADHMAAYILQMEQWFPDIPIGQIDLYPEVDVARFKEWVIALEARGVTIPFLHIDVNGPRVVQYNAWGITVDMAADFAELEAWLDARGIDFGVIFTDLQWNSQLWEPGTYTDQTYYEEAMAMVNMVEAMNVQIDHRIYQSWVKPYFTTGEGPGEVPINLPEEGAYTHTRLLNDALNVVVGAGPPSGRPPRALLGQNQPNPFGTRTTIRYELEAPAQVTLQVYDVRGRSVQTLAQGRREPGRYAVEFLARDLPTGVYFYTLQVGERFLETRKMLFVK